MSRVFTTNDSIEFSAGTLGSMATGALTLGFIVKPTNSHRGGIFDAYATGFRRIGCNPYDDGNLYFNVSGFTSISYAGFIGNWVLVFITKPAGNATVRFHTYDYNTATWSHTDGGAVNVAGAGINQIFVGPFDAGQWLQATMLIQGMWSGTELSDANIETLEFSMNAWLALTPSALWAYPDNTDAIVDATGNGADQVARIGTTNSSDAPVGWSFDDVVTAEFDITLPALSAAVTGDVEVGATFNITLPALQAAVEAEIPVMAEFDITLPSLTSHIVATSTGTGDTFVTALAEQLLACLCEAVSLQPNPPEHCCYRVGLEVAHDAGINEDMCCEGIAYVALGDSFPSDRAPEQDIQRQADAACAPPSWIQVFKVGIIRCVPTGDEFNPPSCTDWNTAFTQNIADALSLRQAQCCMRDWIRASETFMGMTVIMDRQTQGSPLGGCVERSFTISIQFPNCDC